MLALHMVRACPPARCLRPRERPELGDNLENVQVRGAGGGETREHGDRETGREGDRETRSCSRGGCLAELV